MATFFLIINSWLYNILEKIRQVLLLQFRNSLMVRLLIGWKRLVGLYPKDSRSVVFVCTS